MYLRRAHFKLGLILLISGGAIACTCGALDVDFRQVVHGLLQAVGIRDSRQTSKHLQEIIVSAGNELTITAGTQTITPVAAAEVARRLAWAQMYEKGGWLNFRGQSLETVAAEFNRHNKRQLRIGDPQTGRLRVGGTFQVNDLDAFVAALGMTHGVRATLTGVGRRFGEVITLSGGNSAGSAEVVGPPEMSGSSQNEPTEP